MEAVTHLSPTVGVVAACDFLGVTRASFYRQRPLLGPSASPLPEPSLPADPPAPARALSPDERASVRPSYMINDFKTARRRPCRPPCWTKVSTIARLGPVFRWKYKMDEACIV